MLRVRAAGAVEEAIDMVERADVSTAPILDRGHLGRQTFDDAELQAELIALFLGQCAKLAPVIEGEADARARADAAHTLKGGARGIGAFAVAQAAEAVEKTLREEGTAAPGALGSLREAIAAFEAHVRA